MTAPLTPHDQPGQPSPHDPSPLGGAVPYPTAPDPSGPGPSAPGHSEPGPELRAELVQAALVAIGVAVSGVLLGLLWLWLAPRIPLVWIGDGIYPKDAEGEQAMGADGVFTLWALAFGAVSAALVFLFFRRGGVALVVGLAIGGVLASVIAWRLGVWLGPEAGIEAHAKAVGKGVTFDAPLKLGAKGALLAWSFAAMAVHLGLTSLFGPRDEEPMAQLPG
ncbi:DUF2567 domain-containing protein [Streptomyces milbemycinicus]|uniref:DUF2567 domain-containing protein n=1 Tax=Streptomyces milbemycinicus TaxID=476552 RepID=UPI003F4CBF7F